LAKIVPTSRPPAAEAPDPALAAVRALVAAAPAPLAVFDAAGVCLVANPAFVLHAARDGSGNASAGSGEEVRTAFTPDGTRAWRLASVVAPNEAPRSFDFIDVVANALPIMFNAKDNRGRYLFMNRYQADLYGVTPRAAVGRTAADLLGETYGRYTGAIDADVLRSGRATAFFEEAYAGVDGKVRHWLTSKVPLVAAGTVWGVATVAVDISDRKAAEERLRQAREQIAAASQARARFLVNMNHDLRTPLNAVIGFAEIMREEALGPLGAPEYAEYAGLILRSGMALLDLITNLLDLARADTGSLELSIGDVELMRLLRSVVGSAQQEMMDGGSERPTVEISPPNGMLAIRADEQRLRQLLRVLIGNALRSTPTGGRVSIAVRPLAGGQVEVAVTDGGLGLSPAEIEHVFDPSWQPSGRAGRARDAAAMGLNLARQLAALHGGTLALECDVAGGTRAVLRLPRAPALPAAATVTTAGT
jgi:PAS domain S-box-containing protein